LAGDTLDVSSTRAGDHAAGGEGINMMCDALILHEAYKRGDVVALKRLLGDPPDFPNCRGPAGAGEIILEYAIYHGPLPFIRTLLELGADPNARTGIDDSATPLEQAEHLGRSEAARTLRKLAPR
jgi:hypothetical protein